MMKSLVLLGALAKRHFIELRRYAFNTLSGYITLLFVFLLIFYGAKAFLEPSAGEDLKLSTVVVGYVVWMLAIFSYGDTAEMLQQEAAIGTLEQLAMSPLGLPRVMLLRFVAGVAFSIGQILLLLLAMMAASGRWLNVDLVSVIPLMLLTITGVQGLGFIMGGLAIVYKRIQQAVQILQFIFVAMIAAPIDEVSLFKYLPLSWGYRLIRRVMVEGASVFDMLGDFLFLAVHSLVWLAIGFVIFRWFESKARREAKLAHY
jgi:ABC-2 type transport system permease protein